MSNETLFFICGGILAASAVTTSVIGLKAGDKFPGKWMPVIIIWFAAFAVLSGTFAVLHGKDESRDHDAEYAKASEEIQKRETTGPFEEAEAEKREEEEAESGESAGGGEESSESGESSEEENEASGEEAEVEQEGAAGEEMEGEAEGSETAAGGDAESGAVVFSENCSVCHGATGHGGNGGPDLTTMPLAQSEAGAIEQVTNGGGGMPAFAGTLSEEEIENVAAYVAQDITEGEPKK